MASCCCRPPVPHVHLSCQNPLTEDVKSHAVGCSLHKLEGMHHVKSGSSHTSTFSAPSHQWQLYLWFNEWDLRTLLLQQADMSSLNKQVVGAPRGRT